MQASSIINSLTHYLKQYIQELLRKFNYRVNKISTINCFEPLLYLRLNQTKQFYFIQIGANDGKLADPIYHFVTRNHNYLKGLALEPMHDVYNQLCNTYKNYPNVQTANLALHNTEKEMILYKVDPKKMRSLPVWAKGIASFDSNHHKLSDTPSEFMIKEKVNCITSDELLESFNISHIDLLQIDTEGYDAEIIKGFDFEKLRPAIIHFEHGLKSSITSYEDFYIITDLLHHYGYEIIVEDYDATAYLINSILPASDSRLMHCR